jgi:asparagine synthase (glutamine-hydrolysing)
MPGLSFICTFNRDLIQKETRIMQSLQSLVHTKLYKSDVLHHDESYFLGTTKYAEYPFTLLQNDKYVIYIEGKIYGKNNSLLYQEILDLVDNIILKKSGFKKLLAEWLFRTDGEFIITALEKNSKKIIVFNDVLGRLPFYYRKTPQGICMSREVRFIANFYNDTSFDRMAIAEYLLLGFPLGGRTLMENISCLEPATLVSIDLPKSGINFESIYTFNFDNKIHSNVSLKENADNLSGLFLEAIKNHTNSVDKNIVSLSGGFDSRAVAAGLHNLKIPFSTVTFTNNDVTYAEDVKVAEELANLFGVPWRLFQVDLLPAKEDILELVKIKSGLNYVGMSFLLPYYKATKELHGNNILFFTGDGGDTELVDLRPKTTLSNSEELLQCILKQRNLFSIDDVSTLTKLEKHVIISGIKNHLESYPEREWSNKYQHFFYYGQVVKEMFEGQDRNRFYFWLAAPFYSLPFFVYVINCPDDMKKRHKLYREFLLRLSKEAAAIRHSNKRFPITSNLGMFLVDTLYPKIPSNLKGSITNIIRKPKNIVKTSDLNIHNVNQVTNPQLKDLEEQIKKCDSISKYFSIPDLRRLGNTSYYKLSILYTLTSTIEQF